MLVCLFRQAFRGICCFSENMKLKLLVIVIVISAFHLYASDVQFYSINDLYGISMREPSSVCKDDNGFVWAASRTGILRLTDDDHRIYQLPYQTADIISVKLAYQSPLLLACTNNGQIFRYNTLYDRFDFLFDLRVPLDNTHISVGNILIENQETFWISSSVGLYKYQEGELSLVEDDPTEVFQATWYDGDHLIFARRTKGLYLMNIHTMECKHIYENVSLFPFHVLKLFYDKISNQVWVGTLSNGLFRYDFNTSTFSRPNIKYLPKQPIQAIEANSDSTILLGIDGQGVWELNKYTNRVLNIYKENADDPSSLRGNGVYDIFCDQNRRVWVCSFGGGVSFFDQASPLVHQITHQVNNRYSLSNNHVNKVLEDSRGNVWFATNNGISCWEVTSNKWRTYYQDKQEQAQVFLALCEDNQGRIWAGAYSSGVYVIDGSTGKELAHYSREEKGSLIGNYVFDIFKDSFGDLWIGSVSSRVVRYHTKEDKFQQYPFFPVYTFTELSSSQLLLACTYGLVLLDKETAESKQLLEGYLIHDMLVVDKNIWICTCGNGLIRFDLENQTKEIFTTESGLPSNYLNGIMCADGYLWLGTENGLCRFDPKDKTVQTYPSILPLSRVSFNLNAHCKLSNGQLMWGTSGGAVSFIPSTIQQIQARGKIFFQDLFISGRSIRDSSDVSLHTPLDSLQKLTLKYHQNTLTLEVLPIGTVAGSKFSWKMEGLDANWSQPSSHRILTYTNIPGGDFLLTIRLYDSSLSQIIAERQIVIRVVPPFWDTWWFRLLILMVIVGVVYFVLRDYVNRLRQRHTEEKVRFFTNTAHDVRTSLTLIKAPIEELRKEKNLTDVGRHYLHLATEQVQRLSKVATQLLDFQKVDIGKEQISLNMIDIVKLVAHRKLMFESFAKSKNIELIFTSTQSSYVTAVDESMMGKVVDNLISNAVKYSYPDSQVYISLDGSKKEWALEVKDEGIGITRKAQRRLFREFYRSENAINFKIVGSGIGLLLAKNYVTMHRGNISCISQENEGSTFRVVIPFKEVTALKNVNIDLSEEPTPFSSNSVEQKSLLPQEDVQPKDMRILIVEDNDDLKNFMQHSLSENFEVFTAEDGVVAWDLIRKQMPDLVISDVMMPNMDGFELCSLMKSTYETSHIPVILLTALSEKAEQLHGLGLGADDYLTKPFDMRLLSQRITSIIRNRETVREKALGLMKGNRGDPVLANELNDEFVKKAMEVVRDNMANPNFGKEEFAAAMNASSSLLYKKMKALTDQSPMDFIKTIRLDHALELLQTRRYTVTEVSELCGFSGLGYFSTVFSKHYGKPPSEYDRL